MTICALTSGIQMVCFGRPQDSPQAVSELDVPEVCRNLCLSLRLRECAT